MGIMVDPDWSDERLKAELAQTQEALAQSEEARRRLESIVSDLQREKFGARSEKLSGEQYHLPLEDVEIAQGVKVRVVRSSVTGLVNRTQPAAANS